MASTTTDAAASTKAILEGLEMDSDRYVALMTKLIGEVKGLQNSPPDFNPTEDNAGRHVLAALEPYTVANGGPLVVEHVHYAADRGNIIIKYPGTGDATKTLGFVGCHLDVVPANPETWDHDPFSLEVDGDKLWGRGTTDCLGHVAAVTELFILLATAKPKLSVTVAAVFIASEEAASVEGVGMDGLVENGKLEFLKNGPVIWVDCADSQPCQGTAGALTWELKATGKLFHSGLPHKGINSLELAMESLAIIQKRFYEDFPALAEEKEYKFACSSSMKPTQWSCHKNSLNQICPHATISGDIRVTPFYENKDVIAAVEKYVAEINADLDSVPTRGPASKYTLAPEGDSKEGEKGTLSITWGMHQLSGVACDLKSAGFAALCGAIKDVKGSVEPYSITGSLPLVKELKEAGFDLQMSGFGLSSVYHANNEYCLLSDMQDAVKVMARVIAKIDE